MIEITNLRIAITGSFGFKDIGDEAMLTEDLNYILNELGIPRKNIYIFEMWMLTLNSFAISIMLTLVCDKIMIGIRSWYGERNIAKKSIIDTKFFV
jgi:hypothetical protein